MRPAQTLRERLGEGPGSERPTRWVTSGRAERRVLWGTGGHLARLRSRGPEGRGPRRESRTSEAVPGGAARLGHPGQRNWSGEQRQDKKEVPPSREKRRTHETSLELPPVRAHLGGRGTPSGGVAVPCPGRGLPWWRQSRRRLTAHSRWGGGAGRGRAMSTQVPVDKGGCSPGGAHTVGPRAQWGHTETAPLPGLPGSPGGCSLSGGGGEPVAFGKQTEMTLVRDRALRSEEQGP